MKTILTVIGKDQKGIIAGVSQKLYEMDINIMDVNQSIMEDYFVMIMLLDFSKTSYQFEDAKKILIETGEKLRMKVNIQREEIFDAMHRI